MNISELNHENWLIFAIRNYNNPLSVTYSDFEEEIGGRAFHETAENAATAYIAYRF